MWSTLPEKEMTLRAVVIGVLVGLVFGAANAYVGLRVGMTVSASIPAAIVGMAVLRALKSANILEGNIIQTIGSSGEALAAGIIFTFPALYIWGVEPGTLRITTIAMLAGTLGVLLMIPLRDYLVRVEDKTLPYPEGRACAKVLEASVGDSARATPVFLGFLVGLAYQACVNSRALGFWPSSVTFGLPFLPKAQIAADLAPELLAVGFLVGPVVANAMVSGGAVGWIVIIPLIAFFGAGTAAPIFPEDALSIPEMSPDLIWDRYIRYIGAGTVTLGGILAMLEAAPSLARSLKDSVHGLFSQAESKGDLPIGVSLLGILGIGVTFALLPKSFVPLGWLGAGLTLAFAFLFVAVSARIVGIVGSSNNPVSGMTIATLIGVTSILVNTQIDFNTLRVQALLIGAIVCIAAAIAADTSQDLKTGYLVRATPYRQQIGQIVGVITSALAVAWVLYLLQATYGIGSKDLPAPQAQLMAVVIQGIAGGKLPWSLLGIGAVLAVIVRMLGANVMAFAIGFYLPFSLSVPIFAGGAILWLLKGLGVPEASLEKGTLFSSGLIAGSALLGVLIALLVFLGQFFPPLASLMDFLAKTPELGGQGVSLAVFLGLGCTLAYIASRR